MRGVKNVVCANFTQQRSMYYYTRRKGKIVLGIAENLDAAFHEFSLHLQKRELQSFKSADTS